MTDADHVNVYTDNSEPSSPHPNEGVTNNPDTLEMVTVQQVQNMIEEEYEVQRLETDQRMKELCDHFTFLIKPLQDAIGVLQTSSQGRQTNSEMGCSSHGHEKKVTYKAFRGTSPPTFEGSTDPIKAVEWLTKVESCFDLAESHGQERVKYATSCLIGGALLWWTTTSKAMEEVDLKALTWDKFKDLFEEKYCPLDRLDELESQFMLLTQGEKSVTAYEDEFLKKSLFAKHQVSTERRKIQRFVKGLRPEIRQFVRGRDISTFGKAVEAARDQEQELALRTSETLTKKQKLTGIFHQNSPRSSSKYSRGRAYSVNSIPSRAPSSHHFRGSRQIQTSRRKEPCTRCGKYHKGRCPIKGPVCYRCGESGHMSFDCSQRGDFYCPLCGEMGHTGMKCPNRRSQSAGREPIAMSAATSVPTAPTTSVTPNMTRLTTNVSGRTLQITADEARDSTNIITGTITINTTPS